MSIFNDISLNMQLHYRALQKIIMDCWFTSTHISTSGNASIMFDTNWNKIKQILSN
jgi:hypothetical protein